MYALHDNPCLLHLRCDSENLTCIHNSQVIVKLKSNLTSSLRYILVKIEYC